MMPAVLMMGIEEKLLVPFGARDGAFHDCGLESAFAHGLFDPFASGPVQRRLANDAALAYLALTHFELRFDQDHQLASWLQRVSHHRDNHRCRNEADVANRQIERFGEVLTGKVPRVHSFAYHHGWVGAKSPVQLVRKK